MMCFKSYFLEASDPDKNDTVDFKQIFAPIPAAIPCSEKVLVSCIHIVG